MNNREVEELFESMQFDCARDTMDDAHQASYDYEGCVTVTEDPADWQKLKRIGAIKVG